MAIPNFSSYRDSIKNAEQSFDFMVENFYTGFGRYLDQFTLSTVPSSSAPSTATACNKTTTGSLNSILPDFSPSSVYITQVNQSTLIDIPCYILVDRLSHQGGLVGNTTSPQTTNLPTAALTRYTDGVGVMMGLSIYASTISSVGVGFSITVSYTNQDGTSGRTSPLQNYPYDWSSQGIFLLLPLQNGDRGVRSVESFTTTTTQSGAGNLGITLFKPLCMIGKNMIERANIYQKDFITGGLLGGIPNISDSACLSILAINGPRAGLGASGRVHGNFFYEIS
jgi:hypothetical protein